MFLFGLILEIEMTTELSGMENVNVICGQRLSASAACLDDRESCVRDELGEGEEKHQEGP